MKQNRLRNFFVVVLVAIVAISGLVVWLAGKYVVPIMTYHNINYTEKFEPNTVSPLNFDKQMNYLKANGYHVIGLDELVDGIKRKRVFPQKTVVITFDDGYQDNYQYAFPVLKKYHLTATFFVLPGLAGVDHFMTWDEIQEMEKGGMSFGSHSLTHPYLPEISEAEQRNQIRKSKELLEEKLGHPVACLAYPLGGFTEPIKKIVAKSGYQCACTTNRGRDRFNQDLYELKRIRFSDHDQSEFILWVKLSGYYNLFRKQKNPT